MVREAWEETEEEEEMREEETRLEREAMLEDALEEELVTEAEGLPQEAKVEMNRRETIEMMFFFIKILSDNRTHIDSIAKKNDEHRLVFHFYQE
jgi:ATP-dependent RNA circularization protein (DNA/RNA ligase family)